MCALTQSPLVQADPGLASQIQGDWITYRGDQFEIKRISKGKVASTFYDWNGELLLSLIHI